MHLEWILNPAGPYAVVAIGMVLCLVLFLSLKRDLRAGDARWARKLAALEQDCHARMESLDERWKELSHISNLLVAPAPPRSGLNLNKRSQALQMVRRGETPQAISEALTIPQNEVELLVKVHQVGQASGLSLSEQADTLPTTDPSAPSAPPSPAFLPTYLRSSR